MNHFGKDEIPILSETHGQRSDEPQDSTFRRNISRTRSASIYIPMASPDPYERQPNLVGHTGSLRITAKTPVSQMSGPLFASPATGKPRAPTIFDPKFHNSLYGVAKGYGRKLFSFCSSWIPEVMESSSESCTTMEQGFGHILLGRNFY
ncbi:uncharacterized protein [Medicago truncatula]|uniref:uncharacterized protein n=1 Tax=Medicago truncatula TaxID=3880 RepID=UPI00196867A6|nr:uncharacterized protein LOC25496694 [Medicago truncatula]XP_039682705.1 uncharacterized protein LOC25496694 [Medicago truncatula]